MQHLLRTQKLCKLTKSWRKSFDLRRCFCHPPTLPVTYFRPLSVSSGRYEQSPRKTFSRNDQDAAEQKSSKLKATQSPRAKSSLRRVAAEAERSKTSRKTEHSRKAQGDHNKKIVTAYCSAEQYDIAAVARILNSVRYSLDPCRTGLYPHVVHFQFTSFSSGGLSETTGHRPGDIFIFPSGTVVAWDVAEESVMNLVSRGLLPAAEGSHADRVETEDLEFVEDLDHDKSVITGERIRLGIRRNHADIESHETRITTDKDGDELLAASEDSSSPSFETNLALAKIAFASGLARSVKLAVLETALEKYFESTRSIPDLLSQGSRLPFTRDFILRKTGELLRVRAQLNLYSELTDSLPDLFWDSRHELGLVSHFDGVGRVLDINVRIRTLNQRMDYAGEIATVLRERLSEKHGLLLEWLIILLIAIEVGFEVFRLYWDSLEKQDPHSTVSMFRRYLARKLDEEQS